MTLILQRLMVLPLVVMAVVTFTFLALRLIPGDPVLFRAAQALTPEHIEVFHRQWGLDQPLWAQYLSFVGDLANGDLGRSTSSGRPVVELLAERYPLTIELAIMAAAIGLVFGVGLGAASAIRPHGRRDYVIRFMSSLFFSIPWFWLAILLMLVFAVHLRWRPVAGLLDVRFRVPAVTNFLLLDTLLAGQWDAFVSALRHMALPALSLSLFVVGYLARITRAQMLEVSHADFIRTAEGKGLSGRNVLQRHVLRNALLPVITVFGILFGQLLAGSVITERVFARPGVSTLLLQGIVERDYPVVQG